MEDVRTNSGSRVDAVQRMEAGGAVEANASNHGCRWLAAGRERGGVNGTQKCAAHCVGCFLHFSC